MKVSKRELNFLLHRLRMGLSQEEVAEKVNVKKSAVSKWETGRALPRAAILVKLSKLYNCTVDELLKEGGEK